MKEVRYSDKINRGSELPLLERATSQLEEVVGPSAASTVAEWDRSEGPNGRPAYTLRIANWPDEAEATFTPEDLKATTLLWIGLHQLWGRVLQQRNHRQLRDLLRTGGGA
jgi:hypothetical protein